MGRKEGHRHRLLQLWTRHCTFSLPHLARCDLVCDESFSDLTDEGIPQAADFYECGADVTIIQRSSTYVMSSVRSLSRFCGSILILFLSQEHGVPGLLKGFYEEGGPSTENADLMLSSLPIDLLEQFHIGATKEIEILDRPLLDGLEKASFKLNPYSGGLFIK